MSEPKNTISHESDFIIDVMQSILGQNSRLAILGRDYFVDTAESCAYWGPTLRLVLKKEWEAEESAARKARRTDADRGIPASLTFKLTNEAKARLDRFDRRLAEARAEDEATTRHQAEKSDALAS